MNTKTPAFILFGLLALRSLAAAAPAYDFFVCANINRNYVIGSKIVTTNGIFQRDAAGEWQHLGYNDTGISALAFDPPPPPMMLTETLGL